MFWQQLSNTTKKISFFLFFFNKTTKKISTHINRLINDGKTLMQNHMILMQNQRQRGLQNMLNSYGSPTSKLDVPPTKWNEVLFDSPIWNQSCAHIKSWLKCPRKFYFGSNYHIKYKLVWNLGVYFNQIDASQNFSSIITKQI